MWERIYEHVCMYIYTCICMYVYVYTMSLTSGLICEQCLEVERSVCMWVAVGSQFQLLPLHTRVLLSLQVQHLEYGRQAQQQVRTRARDANTVRILVHSYSTCVGMYMYVCMYT